MEIKYLHEFVVLAQIRNFNKAANLLYVSQSALSKHIMRIEEEIGGSLFIRSTHKVELSELGKAFLPYAKNIDNTRLEYSEIIAADHASEGINFSIGMLPYFAVYNLTDLIPWFKKNHPDFHLNIINEETEVLRDMLRQKKCDVVIVREMPAEEDEFQRFTLVTDPLAAVLPVCHPLAHEKSISLNQLASENFIMTPSNTFTYQIAVNHLHLAGINPNIIYTTSFFETLIDLVCKGAGISLLTKMSAQRQANDAISIVDIYPTIPVNINVLYVKDRYPSHIVTSVVNYIKNNALSNHGLIAKKRDIVN